MSFWQLVALRVGGLTREQVNHDWFTYYHQKAALNKISYEEYQGLTDEQAKAVCKGLSRADAIVKYPSDDIPKTNFNMKF